VSRFKTSTLCTLAFLAVAGCASSGQQAKTQAASNLTPEQIESAERAGYHVMIAKSGKTLFCHASVKTGSHVSKEECHSVEQWDQINSRGNRDAQAEIKGSSMPPLPPVLPN
jgi:hypothetical protein